MQQFIPFEDDWDMLEALSPDALIPYRIGLLDLPSACVQADSARHAASVMPDSSSAAVARPACVPAWDSQVR